MSNHICIDIDSLERYVDHDTYKREYPEEYQMPMIEYAINVSRLNDYKKHKINNIMNTDSISAYDKFCKFIDTLSSDDLFYLGW